ncbi:MAG TPA: TatD family hydrolase [Thermoplasmata archaeon]|nr:TatD family hydrolase [Thermoplasmata archaeon]
MAERRAIFDNHIHLRADHRGVEAAKDFERAGGTAFMLTHTPYDDVPIHEASDYERAYARTLRMAEAVRGATSIRVFVALGPYPVEFVRLAESIGIESASEVVRGGVDLAGRFVEDHAAVAFGEVGRPHFPTRPDIVRACNDLLVYTLTVARRIGCAVILHTEDPTPQTFAEFASIADRAGFPRDRLVKHHSTPLTRPEENHGLVPSILAKEELVVEATSGSGRFLLETDYIDDPKRPGAVLGPATVPRKTNAWLEKGILSREAARLIHRDLPERTYGIETA